MVQYFFGVMFLGISIYSFTNYIGFRYVISESKPILYSLINNRINKGGRGESYDLTIKYQNKEYVINITSKESDLIENGVYPEIYFSTYTNSVFSKWTITLSLRLTILFFILAFVAVLPWFKLQ